MRTGKVEIRGKTIRCFVVELSKNGARVRLPKPLKRHVTSLKLYLKGLGSFDAEVRWSKGAELGLLLNGEIASFEEKENAPIQDILRVT